MNIKKNAAFTLIELLVVVLIIGILAAVALPQYEKAVERTRAAEGVTLSRSICTAQQVYYMSHGHYTDNIEILDIQGQGQIVSWDGTPSRNTKNFSCRAINANSSSASFHSLAVCRRIKDGTDAHMYYIKSDPVTCVPQCAWSGGLDPDGEEWCQKITGKETGPYIF